VATIFIASWDNSLDRATANRVLRRDPAVAGAFRRTAGDRHDGQGVTDDVPESVF
jgi:hypothetical protein